MNDDTNTAIGDVDQEIVLEFLDESTDGLNTVSNLLVQLEVKPNDLELINAIFRPVHSLKGNSAFFGLMKVKDLSHKMENLLDKLRKQQLQASTSITEILLEGIDMLTEMIVRVRESQSEVEDETVLNELVARLKTVCEGGNADGGSMQEQLVDRLEAIKLQLNRDDKSLLSDFESMLSFVKSCVPGKQNESRTGVSKKEEEPVPIADGPEGSLLKLLSDKIDGTYTAEKANEVLSLLEVLRDGASAKETIEEIEESIRTWHIFMDSAVGFDDLCRETLLSKVELIVELNALNNRSERPENAKSGAVDENNQKPKSNEQGETHKTMRVNEDSIDTFLEYVGELLVVGDMFTNIQKQLDSSETTKPIASKFRRVNETFALLSNDLRNSIMSIRKVAMNTLLQKAPRMVRDIAKHSGKEIAVELEGGDIAVDKSLIDLFDAPLTHMVRNAADHGIEMPDVRERTGKERQGLIKVSVKETDTHIELTVHDTGAGVNYDAIQAKGEALGIVKQGETLTKKQIVDLLFSAGVSTAKEVTDVSGRGVGMDVVKRAIDEGGGSIDVDTAEGEGSIFTVQLPKSVTTQIMDGFLVEVAENAYVLPMGKVLDASRIESEDIHTVRGKGQCIDHQGKLYPIFFLSDILGLTGRREASDEGNIMVTLSATGADLGLVVDEALGIQQVVVRKISGVDIDSDMVSGGALMGDGTVALILDVESLANSR